MAIKNALIIPDCHIPFEDKRAYALMLKVATKLNIHEVVILGDFLDMYGLSRFDKDPAMGDMAALYDLEIQRGRERIEQLELKFPRAKLVFIEGNHEFRLAAYMKQGGGTLRNRISIPKELCLDKRDWTWVPYDHKQRYQILKSDMWARHEPFGSAQPSTQAQKAGDSFIYGHTHRVQQGEYVTKLSGRHIIAINGGWLGDPKQKVFGYVKSLPTWSWGFTIVSTEGKKFDYQIIKIQPDYTCIYNGKAYKG